MKLVIFGLTVTSSWGNGHATLWRGLCRALARDGHDVVFFERDVPYYAGNRDLERLPGGGSLHLFDDWDRVLPLARAELADADVGVVTSYCPDALEATEIVASSPVELRVFYDMDTPVTLERLASGAGVPYVGPRGLRDFDLVLSYTGGPALDELRRRLGARRVAPLYGSVDPDLHHPADPLPWFRSHLSYLGTYAEDRQDMLETLLVEPARRLPHLRFLIGGAQYPRDFPWAENIRFVRHVDPAQHPAFFSSGIMTLNVTRRAMRAMGWCPSGRLFEAAACGTPILSDPWEGLDAFFEPGSEILVATTTEEAIEALRLPPAELRAIARRARERVLDEHTAHRRARELMALLDSAVSASPPAARPATSAWLAGA
ncbi:MAG TPA: glycosyltransferase [Woeseiaceae bacterium]|nr:glycosyltransferase [Woeseiaceae bacterium]